MKCKSGKFVTMVSHSTLYCVKQTFSTYAIKAYGGSEVISTLILNLSTLSHSSGLQMVHPAYCGLNW